MVALSAILSSLSSRRNTLTNMVSAPPRKVFSKQETPSTTTTIPSVAQLPPNLNPSPPPPQPNLRPSPLPQNDTSRPDSPDTSRDDFLADVFDSDDDSDSDSDDDRRTYPKFDYDARFRPLESLDLSKIQDPGPEAEICYTLEDFGPENMKSWCLPDFVSSDVFATVKGGERVYFITEFNEFFWCESHPLRSSSLLMTLMKELVVWVDSTATAGVVTAFNIEGGLEKEARLNKEENEKVCRL
jgi:hypothetical protein